MANEIEVSTDSQKVSRLMSIVDKVLDSQAGKVTEFLEENKNLSPHKMEKKLRRSLRRWEAWEGTAVGATATFPGAGTIVAGSLTFGQLALHLQHAARYVLGVASLHGFDIHDVDRRRALFLAIVLGEDSGDFLGDGSQVSLATLATALTVKSKGGMTISSRIARAMTKRIASASAKRFAGRLMPFGIGAVVGHIGGRRLAARIIDSTKKAFPDKLAK